MKRAPAADALGVRGHLSAGDVSAGDVSADDFGPAHPDAGHFCLSGCAES